MGPCCFPDYMGKGRTSSFSPINPHGKRHQLVLNPQFSTYICEKARVVITLHVICGVFKKKGQRIDLSAAEFINCLIFTTCL